jgi:haloalkane dehalogenase
MCTGRRTRPRDSRRPLLAWPRAWPIDGEPADVAARMDAYDRWLATSQEVPKLLLTFDGPPDLLIIGPELISWCEANITNLDIETCGPAGHLAPEDQRGTIAAAIARWADRHEFRASRPELGGRDDLRAAPVS